MKCEVYTVQGLRARMVGAQCTVQGVEARMVEAQCTVQGVVSIEWQ